MKKEIIQKVLQDPTTLRALIAQVDGVDLENLTKVASSEWSITVLNGGINIDIYDTPTGTVYIVVYSVGEFMSPHFVLFNTAEMSSARDYPPLNKHDIRFVTVEPGSIEVTGFGPLLINGELATENMSASLYKHYDALTNPSIAELLAIIDGKDIVPDTVLGRSAKEALKK